MTACAIVLCAVVAFAPSQAMGLTCTCDIPDGSVDVSTSYSCTLDFDHNVTGSNCWENNQNNIYMIDNNTGARVPLVFTRDYDENGEPYGDNPTNDPYFQRQLIHISAQLEYSSSYTLVVGAGVRQEGGAYLGEDMTFSFITAADPNQNTDDSDDSDDSGSGGGTGGGTGGGNGTGTGSGTGSGSGGGSGSGSGGGSGSSNGTGSGNGGSTQSGDSSVSSGSVSSNSSTSGSSSLSTEGTSSSVSTGGLTDAPAGSVFLIANGTGDLGGGGGGGGGDGSTSTTVSQIVDQQVLTPTGIVLLIIILIVIFILGMTKRRIWWHRHTRGNSSGRERQ
ncbi:MAG: Ig-like domain-containing protein [Coriobacteriales bacterium]|jgi:hypothetical protein